MSTTLGEALNEAVQCLEQAGIAEPRAAAEVLLADLLSLTRPQRRNSTLKHTVLFVLSNSSSIRNASRAGDVENRCSISLVGRNFGLSTSR
jgi:hypothetical protein